ncbi:MAG: hypothetical protein CAF45_003590 [Nitrospira sp. CG24E]|nr:MAG: hypothetical protein CAF45_003590 [Nitrospira sp. CG24E]
MRRSSIIFNFFGAVGLVGLLGGCGSGGGSSSPATGSASGSAASSGTITGFGSVFVNGKKFEANGVEVRRDDGTPNRCDISPANHCGLKEGMTVFVTGSFNGNEHTADSVQQRDAVEGLVQSIAADGLSLVVMGQTVLVDNTTIFDNNVTSVVGDNVEVNGHIRPNGVIQATFIEKKIAGVTLKVRGFISGHVAATTTFQIGNLTVNYAGAIIGDMPSPSGNNWNDLFVEVKGTTFNSGTTTLTATKVEPENQGVKQADEFEVEGFVTRVDGLGDFFIGSTHVQTTANTEFRGGTIDEIVVGTKLSAEGRLANGILTAKHVKFHESVRLEGNATINGNTLTLAGLPGLTITVNSQTELKDGGNTITLNDLDSNHVRVRGRVSGPTSVIATRIILRSPDSDVDLQGPVQQPFGDPFLTILGVAVDTSGISNDNFEGLNGQLIGRAGFFNAVTVGTLVKVKGRLNGTVVTWREAELED